MSASEIAIFNDIAMNLNNKYLIDLIRDTSLNEKDKSNVSKLVKDYLATCTLYDHNILSKYNINIKFIPVNSDYKCFEAMSFPHMSLKDLLFEKWTNFDKWEEAQLKKILRSTFLIIPIIKHKERGRFNSADKWLIGEICVWKVGKDELKLIGEEWETAKYIVEKGVNLTREKFGKGYRMTNNLLKQSKTNYIHIRPHGINSFDIDKPYFEYTNQNIKITKQSFWLNKIFINNLLRKYRWIMNSKEE
jgi:DNA mismatch repair protein MutH